MKAFFQKNWIHFAAVAVMFIIVAVYFSPQFDGYGLKQHDAEQWKGMANETETFRRNTGEQTLWTNSMFGGMPTVQISIAYTGNLLQYVISTYNKVIPSPMGVVFLHMLSFYLMALLLRIRPVIGLIGAVAFSFASYEIIILPAGHLAKSLASAYLPLLFGTFVYAYRNKSLLGALLSGVVMTLELAANHIQVTYYMIFLLLFVGIYYFIDSIKNKQFLPFAKITAGLIVAYVLAALINSPNLVLTNDYAKHTIRGVNDVTINPDGTAINNQSKGLDRDYITQWSYGIGETFTLISPNVKGGGSFPLQDSQFESILENSDLSISAQNTLKNYPAYWGDQPFTSGPVYVGIVVALLAFLGLIFIKSNIKWALFGVTILAIILSWGKNYMGFTNFFIDHVPGYDKFRTVTIILILVELCIPILGIMFLDALIKEKEEIKQKKSLLIGSVAAFFVFLVLVKMIGLGDGYSSQSDKDQLAGIESKIIEQLSSIDPNELKSQYNLDINNPQQVKQFVDGQMQTYEQNFEDLKTVRKDIFDASMNRSLTFTFFAGALILLFVFVTVHPMILMGGLLILTMIDMLPVANEYLGKQDVGNNYKYWEDIGVNKYPVIATTADEQILQRELVVNPALQKVIEKGEREARIKADELGIEGTGRRNLVDSYRFAELNLATNYRVFDLNGGFNSSHASYFHKSLGGYHGAKLRNIANLMDFHLSKMNNKVYDILNVKYFIQNGEQGPIMRPNPTAIGNAWLVKRVEEYATPNDEIRALGSVFSIENKGMGRLFVNGKEQKNARSYGSEKLQYLLPNSKDTLIIPLTNGMSEGMEAMWVMDARGQTNLVPLMTLEADTENSFLKLVQLKVENEFKPTEEVVMLKSEAAKLSSKTFTGEGTVKMTHYAPNKITYETNLNGNQLVVFSEIYYPEGWKAYVDGKEVEIRKVNYLLRGIEVSAGKHKVEMVFDIPDYHKMNLISLISSIFLILITIVASWFYIRQPKKN